VALFYSLPITFTAASCGAAILAFGAFIPGCPDVSEKADEMPCALVDPAIRTAWEVKLEDPAGGTAWEVKLEDPAGGTAWEVKLEGPVGRGCEVFRPTCLMSREVLSKCATADDFLAQMLVSPPGSCRASLREYPETSYTYGLTLSEVFPISNNCCILNAWEKFWYAITLGNSWSRMPAPDAKVSATRDTRFSSTLNTKLFRKM
jgi:hypothetical protein